MGGARRRRDPALAPIEACFGQARLAAPPLQRDAWQADLAGDGGLIQVAPAAAIREPIEAMGWPLRVVLRNGDSSASERGRLLRTPHPDHHPRIPLPAARQRRRTPGVRPSLP